MLVPAVSRLCTMNCLNACGTMQDIARYETVMLSAIQQPAVCLHFLRPGRLVRIREGSLDWGWGIVVSVMRKAVAVNAGVQAQDMGPPSAYILDLLLSCDAASVKGAALSSPPPPVPLTFAAVVWCSQFQKRCCSTSLCHLLAPPASLTCCCCVSQPNPKALLFPSPAPSSALQALSRLHHMFITY